MTEATGTPRGGPRDRPGKVVVVGQGYVGLALAMRAVEVGYDVVGFDQDEERVKRLAGGDSYVEDVPDAVLARRWPPAGTSPPTKRPAAPDSTWP